MIEKDLPEMPCRELVEVITDYLEDRLSPVDRARFEAHLAECEACRTYVEQFRQTIRALGRLPEESFSHQQLPAFATISLGGFKLLLSGPGASGSRPMPDGRRQEAGGWNRIVLHVTDVVREIERLENAGGKFRNEMETGPAGRQIQLEDPDGNPIELFEPAPR